MILSLKNNSKIASTRTAGVFGKICWDDSQFFFTTTTQLLFEASLSKTLWSRLVFFLPLTYYAKSGAGIPTNQLRYVFKLVWHVCWIRVLLFSQFMHDCSESPLPLSVKTSKNWSVQLFWSNHPVASFASKMKVGSLFKRQKYLSETNRDNGDVFTARVTQIKA